VLEWGMDWLGGFGLDYRANRVRSRDKDGRPIARDLPYRVAFEHGVDDLLGDGRCDQGGGGEEVSLDHTEEIEVTGSTEDPLVVR